jgi:hypothetical protein
MADESGNATRRRSHDPRRSIASSPRRSSQTEIVLALTGHPCPSARTISVHAERESGVERTGLGRAPLRPPAHGHGHFVYVVNGAQPGCAPPSNPAPATAHHVEILDGLYAGDIVATAGVEQLWLTELRLTKGGGHSH